MAWRVNKGAWGWNGGWIGVPRGARWWNGGYRAGMEGGIGVTRVARRVFRGAWGGQRAGWCWSGMEGE